MSLTHNSKLPSMRTTKHKRRATVRRKVLAAMLWRAAAFTPEE